MCVCVCVSACESERARERERDRELVCLRVQDLFPVHRGFGVSVQLSCLWARSMAFTACNRLACKERTGINKNSTTEIAVIHWRSRKSGGLFRVQVLTVPLHCLEPRACSSSRDIRGFQRNSTAGRTQNGESHSELLSTITLQAPINPFFPDLRAKLSSRNSRIP